MSTTNNWLKGLTVNFFIAIGAYIIGNLVGKIINPLSWTNTWIGIAAAVTAIYYFGWEGLKQIPVGSKGAAIFFGKRVKNTVLDEGWVWYWPSPIGNIKEVDTTKQTYNQEITTILSLDDVAIGLDLSSEIQVVDPQLFLNVSNPTQLYKEAADGILRLIVSKLKAETVPRANVGIIDVLLNGSGGTNSDGSSRRNGIPGISENSSARPTPEEIKGLEDFEADGLKEHALKEWGIDLIKVRITAVRLPENLEKARANVRVEVAQREAEKIEVGTVVELMEEMKRRFPNLSDQAILNAVQSERGKVTRVVVDGNAAPIVQAGALAGNNITLNQN